MTRGTHNLVLRLKLHLKHTELAIRHTKGRLKTPYPQREPPTDPYNNDYTYAKQLAELATLLCIARAEMRGRKHFGAREIDQRQHLSLALVNAEAWEELRRGWKKSRPDSSHPTTHPTLPLWMRNTLRAAITAADVERGRQAQHAPRRAKFYEKEVEKMALIG